MKDLILMIQFFTRIPIGQIFQDEEKDFSKGLPYFPLVGLLIGIFNYLVFKFFSLFRVELIAVTSWIFANIVITGALHIDGLADTCDGILSYREKEKMLEIMRDSRIGVNGVIAIIMDFLARIVIMFSLSKNFKWIAILLSPVIARGLLMILIWFTPYARKTRGIGGAFYNKKRSFRMVLGLIPIFLLILIMFSLELLFAMIITIIVIYIYRRFIIKKIDGMTGDTLGAANELAEITFMFFLLISERFL